MEAAPRSVSIKARSSFTHEEAVHGRGQHTRWQWRLEQYDIVFSLLFTAQPAAASASAASSDPSTVVIHQPTQLDSSHPLASSSYTHKRDRPGRLIFTFSNAHSAFRTKQLTFTVASFPSVLIPLGTTIASPLGPTTILARLPSSLYLCRLPYGTASLHPEFLLPHWPERDAQDGSRRQETSSEVNRRAMVGVWLFFTNHLEESEAFFRSEMQHHAMFSLAFACIGFLRALMTWERDDMQEANDRINATRAAVAHLLPADTTLTSFTRLFSSSPPLSDAELEATLITAETLILQALLLLVEENVMSLVQAGLRIRSSHRLFDRCWEEVKRRQRRREDGQPVQDIDSHVLGGVQNGMGTFLVVLSLLPPIMLRVLSFLGFSSSRSQGLAMLHASAACNGLRSPLSSLVLLFLHTIIPSFFTARVQHHVEQSSAILASSFRLYPRGSFFLWLQGRQQRNSRLLPESTASFLQAADGQREWRQLQHLCAYELGVSYAFMLRWEQADHWWRLLENENQWSKGFYAYMQCVTVMERVQDAEAAAEQQQQQQTQETELKAEAERRLIDEKIAKVVVYCDRKLGGKQLSLEQFILQRCDEWRKGRRLMLPTLEIVFLYHGFACMETELLTRCLHRVEAELLTSPYWSAASYASSALPAFPVDAAGMSMSNHCLLLLLLSSLLHQLKRSDSALPHLHFILSHSHLTAADPYLTPFAQFELATVHLEALLSSGSGSAEEVKDEYRKASQWKGSYHFKNRLHLRIHLAVTELKQRQAAADDAAADAAGHSDASAAGLDETEGEDSMEAMSQAESDLIAGIRQREEDRKES